MKRVCLGLIKIYQLCLSPFLGNQCRFFPSCSEYAAEAIDHYGIFRGIALAAKRIAKCSFWHPGGHDPVPEKKLTGYPQDKP